MIKKIFIFSLIGSMILCSNNNMMDWEKVDNEKKRTALDQLGPDVIGTILCQLNYQIGTQGFINKKDINVIVKNVHKLAAVNKKLYTLVNDYIATNLLINSLARRFNMPCVEMATSLNTKASKEWLKQFVMKSGDYDLFKVVQNIFGICAELREKFSEYSIKIGDGQKSWPGSNPCDCQTNQGLMLSSNTLFTPWGKVELFNPSCGYLASIALQQEFLKKIIANFYKLTGCSSEDKDKVEFYELIRSIDLARLKDIKAEMVLQKISKEQLKSKEGTQAVITSNYCDAIYKIMSVGKDLLPDPQLLEYSKFRSYATINAIWEVMEQEFNKGKLPVSTIESSKTKYEDDVDMVREKQALPALYQPIDNIVIKNINDLPNQYSKLAQLVFGQPVFSGEGCISSEPCKILTCTNYSDCRILEDLIRYSNKSMEEKSQWHLGSIGCGNNQRYINNTCLGNGLELTIYPGNVPCSIETLEANFKIALQTLQTGWKQSKLIENRDISLTESEEEWYLFIKKKLLNDEDTLIRFLACKFNLHNKISCHDYWDGRQTCRGILYLWVRKNYIEQVKEILGFNLCLS